MQPLDPESRLTEEAIERLKHHLVDRKITRCCADPRLAPVSEMFSWPVAKRHGESMTTSLAEGTPVMAVACTSCGQVKTFLVQLVFPDGEGEPHPRKS